MLRELFIAAFLLQCFFCKEGNCDATEIEQTIIDQRKISDEAIDEGLSYKFLFNIKFFYSTKKSKQIHSNQSFIPNL